MSHEAIRHYGEGRAYQLRWDKVTDIRSELQAELVEGEVLWGTELHEKYVPLFKLQQELFTTIHLYLRANDPGKSNQSREAMQRALAKRRDVAYDLSDETPDEFTKDVAEAISGIESFLKPHLRK